MKICFLRPCMIYGPNAKGNFPRLAKPGAKVLVFPAWHNKRSMLYINNLTELQIPAGQFHSLEVPAEWEKKTVILEFKAGKFEPAKTEDILVK